MTGRVSNGLLWMYLSSGVSGLLQLPLLAVLARLVSPADFGLVTASLAVLAFGTLFAQAGLDTALVQRRDLGEAHVRAAYGASLTLSATTASLVFLTAPSLARLVGLPDAAPLIRTLSVVLVIEGLTLGPALLLRDLRFRAIAVLDLVGFVFGYGAVAVALALRGWGAGALIAGRLGQAVVSTLGHWIARPHTLRPWLARRPLGELLRVGGGELLARLLGTFGTQADSLVVGRWLGASALGFYGRAYRLMELPTTLFTQAIRKVLFPVMATMQDDRDRLGRTYLTGVGVLTAVTLPVCLVLALVAEEVVLTLLGPDWRRLVPVFRILVLAMLFRASPSLSDSLVLACGAVYRQAARVAFFALLVTAGALLGRRWGVPGVAVGVLVAMAGNYLAMARLSLRLAGLGWGAFWRVQRSGVQLAAAVVATTTPTVLALRIADAPPIVVVLVAALVAGVTEVALVRLASRVRGLAELASLVRRVLELVPPSAQARAVRALALPAT